MTTAINSYNTALALTTFEKIEVVFASKLTITISTEYI